MVEPFSCLIQAARLTTALYEATASIAAFLSQVQIIDQSIRALSDELNSLHRVVRAIDSCLHTPGIRTYGNACLWNDIDDCLNACCTTVATFTNTFRGSQVRDERRSFLRGAVRTIRLNWREGTLATLRAQFNSHHSAMHIILQMINIHILTNTERPTWDDLNKQLDALKEFIGKGQAHDDHMATKLNSGAILQTNHRIRESARSLLSNASVAEESLFGVPLNKEKINNIEDWVSHFPDDGELPTKISIDEASNSVSDAAVSRTSSPTTTTDSVPRKHAHIENIGATSVESQDNYDEDIIKGYLQMAYQYFEQGKFGSAETAFKRVLQSPRRMTDGEPDTNEIDILSKTAQACFEQDKFDQARQLCERVIGKFNTDDLNASRTLDASFLLAQVYYCQGKSDLAIRECLRCRQDRFQHAGKDDAYFKCIALLVAIYEDDGNELDASVHSRFLPTEFEKPAFKRPIKSSDTAGPARKMQAAEPALKGTLVDVPVFDSKSEQGHVEFSPSMTSSRADALLDDGIDLIWEFKPLVPNPPSFSAEFPCTRKESKTSSHGSEALIGSPTRTSIASKTHCPSTVSPRLPVAHVSHAPTPSKFDPFFQAIEIGALEKVTMYLEGSILPTTRKAYKSSKLINAVNYYDLDAIHLAAKAGQLAIVQLLLHRGANLDRNLKAWGTPLHLAARYGHLAAADFFLQCGADKNAETHSRGWTVLQMAAMGGHDSVVQLLVQRGAKVNGGAKHSALHFSAEFGMLDSVKALVAAGADVNDLNKSERTPLHLAARAGHGDIVAFLADSGAHLELRDDPRKLTALHHAADRGRMGVVQELLHRGVDTKCADALGFTPLHTAAERGFLEIVEILLQLGVPLGLQDQRGRTPLQVALDAGHQQVVRRLTLMVDDGRNSHYR